MRKWLQSRDENALKAYPTTSDKVFTENKEKSDIKIMICIV